MHVRIPRRRKPLKGFVAIFPTHAGRKGVTECDLTRLLMKAMRPTNAPMPLNHLPSLRDHLLTVPRSRSPQNCPGKNPQRNIRAMTRRHFTSLQISQLSAGFLGSTLKLGQPRTGRVSRALPRVARLASCASERCGSVMRRRWATLTPLLAICINSACSARLEDDYVESQWPSVKVVINSNMKYQVRIAEKERTKHMKKEDSVDIYRARVQKKSKK